MVQFICIVEFRVPGRQEVLTHNTELGMLSCPPTEPGIEPVIAGYCFRWQAAYVVESAIQIQVMRQTQERTDLKLMVRSIASNFCHCSVGAIGVGTRAGQNVRGIGLFDAGRGTR